MISPTDTAVQITGWVILHSLWQVTVAWLFNAVAQRLLARASANVRYVTACTSTFAAVLVTLLTAVALTSGRSIAWPLPLPPAHGLIGGYRIVRPFFAWQATLDAFHAVLPWLVTAWVAWAVARLTFVTYAFARLQVASRRVIPLNDADAPEVWHSLRQRLTPGLRVRLAAADYSVGPAVIGWLRPMVLVPIGFFGSLSPEAVEAILAHELAHVRRRDYLINLLQIVSETFLGYHPLMRSLHRQVRDLREMCCDDIAASVADRRQYAEALFKLHNQQFAPRLAMGLSGSPMFMRIARLLEASPARGWQYLSRSIAACTALMCLLGLSAPDMASKIAFDVALADGYRYRLSEAVYQLLAPSKDNAMLVPAVVEAVNRLRAGQFDERAATRLAEVVAAGGDSHALLGAALPSVTAATRRPLPNRGWAGGTGTSWDKLSKGMYDMARRSRDPAAARTLTRASLLLSAQYRINAGGIFQLLAREPDIAPLAGLNRAQTEQLTLLVSIDRERRSADGLAYQTWVDGRPSSISDTVREKLKATPEGQWLVANYIYATARLEPSRAALLLESARTGGDFALCLQFLSR